MLPALARLAAEEPLAPSSTVLDLFRVRSLMCRLVMRSWKAVMNSIGSSPAAV